MVENTTSQDGSECPLELRPVSIGDEPLMGALQAEIFGPGRFARTAYRIREGLAGPSPHCRALWQGDQLAGSVTLTEVFIGGDRGHWLLGPLAVRPVDANKGLGRQLVGAALKSISAQETQRAQSIATVILVGDLAYYERFGFEQTPPGQIILPGPVDPSRLLIWRGSDGTRKLPAGLVRAANR